MIRVSQKPNTTYHEYVVNSLKIKHAEPFLYHWKSFQRGTVFMNTDEKFVHGKIRRAFFEEIEQLIRMRVMVCHNATKHNKAYITPFVTSFLLPNTISHLPTEEGQVYRYWKLSGPNECV